MNAALFFGLFLVGPPPTDLSGSSRYLSEERLLAEVGHQVLSWSCPGSALETQSVTLRLNIAGTGAVSGSVTAGDSEPCWQSHLDSLSLPAHQETVVEAQATLLVSQGQVVSLVSLERDEHTRFPVFLYVPNNLTETQRDALIEALGFASRPLEE